MYFLTWRQPCGSQPHAWEMFQTCLYLLESYMVHVHQYHTYIHTYMWCSTTTFTTSTTWWCTYTNMRWRMCTAIMTQPQTQTHRCCHHFRAFGGVQALQGVCQVCTNKDSQYLCCLRAVCSIDIKLNWLDDIVLCGHMCVCVCVCVVRVFAFVCVCVHVSWTSHFSLTISFRDSKACATSPWIILNNVADIYRMYVCISSVRCSYSSMHEHTCSFVCVCICVYFESPME